jgi:mono/diheme cytochrome c family protein
LNSLSPASRVCGTMFALLSLGLLLLTGCSSNDTANSPSQPPQGASPGRAATGAGATGGGDVADKGKAVFAANNCGNCHALNGQGGGKAPDLSKIGGEHDATWIAAHVKDPKTHNPNSKMPAFDKLSEDDLKALSDYLASLK